MKCFILFWQVRVKIEGDNEPQPTTPREEGQVPFVFVGTVESIANAKVLLEYHLAHLKEVEALRQEKQEIDQQLRSIHGSSQGMLPPSMPYSRRPDRGYSTEMDGGGRGRGRGGSRGRGGPRHSEPRFNAGNTSFLVLSCFKANCAKTLPRVNDFKPKKMTD